MNLLPHQITALEFINSRLNQGVGVLNADSAGTGKTLPALLAARAHTPKGKICLWITLASLKLQLENEILKFSVPFTPFVLKGNKTERLNDISRVLRGEADMLVVNYEQVLLHGKEFSELPISVIVSDECIRLGNTKNKTYKYVKKIAEITKAKKIALSGSPIISSPLEAYALFDYLNTDCLGRYWPFVSTYFVPSMWAKAGFIRTSRLPELAARLAPYYIRREREVLLPDLPDLMEETLLVELTPEENKFYNLICSEMLLEMKKDELDHIENPITMHAGIVKFMRLRQYLVHPALLGSAHKKFSKMEALKEFLSTINGAKAIIFTEFASAVPYIQAEIGGLAISGQTPQEERNNIINKNPQYLIGTRAIEMGLNLQNYDYCIHLDPPLTYASYDQRNSRARRQGRADKVISVRITVKGTIEDRIWRLIESKRLVSLATMPYSELFNILLN